MKDARRVSLGLSLVGVIVALVWAAFQREGLAPLTEVAFARVTGYGALIFLMMSQAMAPLARFKLISPAFQAAGRRHFGVSAALLATVHGGYGWLRFLSFQMLEALDETVWLQIGLMAWVLLVVLWLTSYPWMVRKLRVKAWKSLHQLAYLALGMGWLHFFLSPWGDRNTAVLMGAVILVLWILRL